MVLPSFFLFVFSLHRKFSCGGHIMFLNVVLLHSGLMQRSSLSADRKDPHRQRHERLCGE